MQASTDASAGQTQQRRLHARTHARTHAGGLGRASCNMNLSQATETHPVYPPPGPIVCSPLPPLTNTLMIRSVRPRGDAEVGTINLQGYFLTRAFDIAKPYAFRLAASGRRTYTLVASSAGDLTRWAATIGQAISMLDAMPSGRSCIPCVMCHVAMCCYFCEVLTCAMLCCALLCSAARCCTALCFGARVGHGVGRYYTVNCCYF